MAVSMCTPGATINDLPTFVGWAVIDVDCSNTYTGQYFNKNWVAQGTSAPLNWTPCEACSGGGGGGGGGSGQSIVPISMVWQLGNFEDAGAGASTWPDGGLTTSIAGERWTEAPIAGSFTTWTCVGIKITVHNVAAATSGNIQVSLKDDVGNVFATVTIASGTSPDSPGTAKFIQRAASSSSAAVAGTRLQWSIDDAPDGNDYWVEAFALGILT
jgi:hypothetical protein